jgi:outer membrane protein assembly factor BamB
MTRRCLPLLLLCTALGGCGALDTVSEYLPFEEDSPAKQPAELVNIRHPAEVREIWSQSVGEGTEEHFLKLVPVAEGGRLFTADREGLVTAVHAGNGHVAWERDTEAPISGGPGVGEGLVLVGTSDGEVLALSEEDGKVLWRAEVTSEVLAAPAVDKGVVVTRTLDGKLFGLNAESGARLWVYDRQVPVLTLRGTSAPKMHRGLVIAGFDNGTLVALDLRTGKLAWEARIAQPSGRSELERMVDIDAEPLIVDDTLYVATFQGRVVALSLESGQGRWEREISSYAGMGADSLNVYISDDEDHVWALDRYSGDIVWKQEKLHDRSVTAPVSFGEYVVVGDLEGYLHWMRRDDGKFVARVQVDDSRIIAPPFVSDETLFALGSDGVLGAYRLPGPEAETEPESEPESETELEPETETEPESEPELDSESEPDSESESESEDGSKYDVVPKPGSGGFLNFP